MADLLEFQLTGLDEVVAKMKGLTPDLRTKGARTAMRKAANLVRDAAVANAQALDDPKTPESIAKNIAVQFASKTFNSTGDVMMRVGVLGGARQYAKTRENVRKRRAGKTFAVGGSSGNPGGDTFYWRFDEFGTSRQRAKPFMRPALSNNVEAATDVAADGLNKAIDRYVAKGSSS